MKKMNVKKAGGLDSSTLINPSTTSLFEPNIFKDDSKPFDTDQKFTVPIYSKIDNINDTETKKKESVELSFFLTNYLYIKDENQLRPILTPKINLEKMTNDIFEKFYLYNKEIEDVNGDELIVVNNINPQNEVIKTEPANLEGGTCNNIHKNDEGQIILNYKTSESGDVSYTKFYDLINNLNDNSINALEAVISEINRYVTDFNYLQTLDRKISLIESARSADVTGMTMSEKSSPFNLAKSSPLDLVKIIQQNNQIQELDFISQKIVTDFIRNEKLSAEIYIETSYTRDEPTTNKQLAENIANTYNDYLNKNPRGLIQAFNSIISDYYIKWPEMNSNPNSYFREMEIITTDMNKLIYNYDFKIIAFAYLRKYLLNLFDINDSQIQFVFVCYNITRDRTSGYDIEEFKKETIDKFFSDTKKSNALKYIYNLYSFFKGIQIRASNDTTKNICELITELVLAKNIFSINECLYICDCKRIVTRENLYEKIVTISNMYYLNNIVNKMIGCISPNENFNFNSYKYTINLNTKTTGNEYNPTFTYTKYDGITKLVTEENALRKMNPATRNNFVEDLKQYKIETYIYTNTNDNLLKYKEPLYSCTNTENNERIFTNNKDCTSVGDDFRNEVIYEPRKMKNYKNEIISKFIDILKLYNPNIPDFTKEIYILAGIFSKLVYLSYDSIFTYVNNYNMVNTVNKMIVRGYYPDPEWNSVTTPYMGYNDVDCSLNFYENSKHYMYSFILIHPDINFIFIVHRGSHTSYDWITSDNDIAGLRGQYTKRANNAFFYVNKIIEDYKIDFRQELDKPVRIYTCGHSLGGFLSFLTAYKYKFDLSARYGLNIIDNYIRPIVFNPFMDWRPVTGSIRPISGLGSIDMDIDLNCILLTLQSGLYFRTKYDTASLALSYDNYKQYRLINFTLNDDFLTKRIYDPTMITEQFNVMKEKATLDHDMINFIGLQETIKMLENMSKLVPPQYKFQSENDEGIVEFENGDNEGFPANFKYCNYNFGSASSYNDFIPEYITKILSERISEKRGGKSNKSKKRKVYRNKTKKRKVNKNKSKRKNT
jgi:hypothetical protein